MYLRNTTRMNQITWIICNLLLLITTVSCNGIHISPTGNDVLGCGNTISNSCQTIGYAMKNILQKNGTLILDGNNDAEYHVPRNGGFVIEHSLNIRKRESSTSNPKIVGNATGYSDFPNFIVLESTLEEIEITLSSVDFHNVGLFYKTGRGNLSVVVRDSIITGFGSLFQRSLNKTRINIHHPQSLKITFDNLQIHSSSSLISDNGDISIDDRDTEIIIRSCTFSPPPQGINFLSTNNYNNVSIQDSILINTLIMAENTKNFAITDTLFKHSSATFKNALFLKISKCVFAGKYVTYMFHLTSIEKVQLDGVEISQTEAYIVFSFNGINHLELNNLSVKNSSFKHFILGRGHVLFLNNLVFTNNEASSNVFDFEGEATLLENITFSRNNAYRYNLFRLEGTQFIMRNAVFDSNTCGTLLQITNSQNIGNVENVQFVDNIVKNVIIFAYKSDLFIRMTSQRNRAQSCITIKKGNVNIKFSTFTNDSFKETVLDFADGSAMAEGLTFRNESAELDIVHANNMNSLQLTNTVITGGSYQTFASFEDSEAYMDNVSLYQNAGHLIPTFIHFQGESLTQDKLVTFTNIKVHLENIFRFEQKKPILDLEYGMANFAQNLEIQMNNVRGSSLLKASSISLNRRNIESKPMKFNLICPNNYNPESNVFMSKGTIRFEQYCKACPKGTYKTKQSSLKLNGTIVKEEDVLIFGGNQIRYLPKQLVSDFKILNSTSHQCLACPPGGLCEYDFIARDNFYGIISPKDSSLKFFPCPEDYCCSSSLSGKRCTSYNTCNYYRGGTLCGRCSDGYYVSYFTNKCIAASECTLDNQVIFWLIYVTSGFLMGVILSFTKDIISIPKRLLAYVKKREYVQRPKTDTDIPFGTIINILMSFYQLQSLMFVRLDQEHVMETSYISRFFNLDLVLKKTDTICPINTLNPVLRGFLKDIIFPVVMLSAVMLLLAIVSMKRMCDQKVKVNATDEESGEKVKQHWFSRRVTVGYLLVITFSYKNIVNYSLSLLNCVKVNDDKILYISGNVQCFTGWQIVNFVFLFIWVLPLPLSMIYSFRKLLSGEINSKQFLFCVSFPLGAIFMPKKTPASERELERQPSSKEIKVTNIRQIMREKFEWPYRTNYFWWEAWVLYERVFVSMVTIFVIDPVVRLYILAPLIVFFLWLHTHVHPYKTSMKLLTFLDLTSYVFLCLHLVSDMFRAVVYDHNLPRQFPIDTVVELSNYFQQIFSPLWPLVLMLFFKFVWKKVKPFLAP